MLGSLAEHQFHIDIKKFFFGQTRLEYLVHWISHQGVSTNSSKMDVVQGWPSPQNVCQPWGFLGLASFYQWFVLGHIFITWVLTQLLMKGGVAWTPKSPRRIRGSEGGLIISTSDNHAWLLPTLCHGDRRIRSWCGRNSPTTCVAQCINSTCCRQRHAVA